MKLIYSVVLTGLFIGCGVKTKEVEVVKYKYITPQYPCLKEYKIDDNLTLKIYNKNGFVCFKDKSGCIKKEKLLKIVSYIFELKTINDKLLTEVKEYNKRFCNKGNKWNR